jgi:hypothetical protein
MKYVLAGLFLALGAVVLGRVVSAISHSDNLGIWTTVGLMLFGLGIAYSTNALQEE